MGAPTNADLRRHSGRLVAVTGGGSGIGRACCLRFADEGATVVVTDVEVERAKAVADEIKRRGGSAEAWRIDVADPACVGTWSEIASRPGGLAVLVNNAGVGFRGNALETDEETWRRLFSVNVDGVRRATVAVLPSMLARRHGSIVNIASAAGIIGFADRFAYCATKAAVVGMTRAAALDFAGMGVRINCVCPGPVYTPYVESRAEASGDPTRYRRELDASQPIGRMGRSEEIAAAVAYLASDEAAFVTGSAMVIDGGMTAGLPRSRLSETS